MLLIKFPIYMSFLYIPGGHFHPGYVPNAMCVYNWLVGAGFYYGLLVLEKYPVLFLFSVWLTYFDPCCISGRLETWLNAEYLKHSKSSKLYCYLQQRQLRWSLELMKSSLVLQGGEKTECKIWGSFFGCLGCHGIFLRSFTSSVIFIWWLWLEELVVMLKNC